MGKDPIQITSNNPMQIEDSQKVHSTFFQTKKSIQQEQKLKRKTITQIPIQQNATTAATTSPAVTRAATLRKPTPR